MKNSKKLSIFLLALCVVIALAVLPAMAENGVPIDPILILSPETNLTVFVDGAESAVLSDKYPFGETASITAPAVTNKTFRYWTNTEGAVISYNADLTISMYTNTSVNAVYDTAEATAQTTSAFLNVTRTTGEIVFNAIAAAPSGSTISACGIRYSATKKTLNELKGEDNVTVAVADGTPNWMLAVTPTEENTTYYAVVYATVGEDTTYSAVKAVKLAELQSSVSMVTNLGDVDLSNISADSFCVVTFDANGGEGVMEPQGVVKSTATTLNVNTFTREGYTFSGWNTEPSGGTSYKDGDTVTLTADTTLYAQWKSNSSGGSSTTTVTVPVTSDTTTGSVPVKASVSGTTATVTKLTDEQLAQVTENKSAGAETQNTVAIDVSGVAKDVKTAVIPTETVKAVEETGSSLQVTLTDGSVELDAAAQTAIIDAAKGTDIRVNLDAVPESSLNAAQRSALKEVEVQKVVDAYITSNGQRISDFKGGTATVSVPYTLKGGQVSIGLVVWYVADDGTRSRVPSSYDGKNVVFGVTHFSNYVIAYDAEKAAACPQDKTCPISKFADADPAAWYHDGVHWALESGVMNGVGDGKFAPNDTTTRAQVVTMLWRLEGSPAYVGMSEFSDVDNVEWYGPAIRWASAEGIVNGYDDGRFGANDAVTREQLVTILYRYAQYKKMDVSVGEDTNILSYDDAFDVSSWAMSAMQWAVGAGVVNGIDKNGTLMLAPSDASTRAVVATLFWRFCK